MAQLVPTCNTRVYLFFHMKSIFREKLATSVALTKANGANASSKTKPVNIYVSPVVASLCHGLATYIIYGCLVFIMFV